MTVAEAEAKRADYRSRGAWRELGERARERLLTLARPEVDPSVAQHAAVYAREPWNCPPLWRALLPRLRRPRQLQLGEPAS